MWVIDGLSGTDLCAVLSCRLLDSVPVARSETDPVPFDDRLDRAAPVAKYRLPTKIGSNRPRAALILSSCLNIKAGVFRQPGTRALVVPMFRRRQPERLYQIRDLLRRQKTRVQPAQ